MADNSAIYKNPRLLKHLKRKRDRVEYLFELKDQAKDRQQLNDNTDRKNRYDSHSQIAYIILVIAMIIFVCAFCFHDHNVVQFNPNGQPDVYRNCQTPYFR